MNHPSRQAGNVAHPLANSLLQRFVIIRIAAGRRSFQPAALCAGVIAQREYPIKRQQFVLFDGFSTVSGIRVDERHTIIPAPYVTISASRPVCPCVSRSMSRLKCSADNSARLRMRRRFSRERSTVTTLQTAFNFAVAADPVLVHRLCATRYPQVEVAKIGVVLHRLHQEAWHLYPSLHGLLRRDICQYRKEVSQSGARRSHQQHAAQSSAAPYSRRARVSTVPFASE